MKDNQINNQDLSDWVDALENLLLFEGKEATKDIIRNFIKHANSKGLIDDIHFAIFENSISEYEENYPGDWEIEETIRHYVRWNCSCNSIKSNKRFGFRRIYIYQLIHLQQPYMRLVLIIF